VWLETLYTLTRLRSPNIRYHTADNLDVHWLENTKSWRLADCGVVKAAVYLRWRYAANPALQCRYVWQLRNNEPIGLAILHLNLAQREAVLLDCIALNDNFWHLLGLIARTMRYARHAGAALWTTHALSSSLDRVLRVLGCGRRQSPFGLSVLCNDASLRARITDPHRWHLMVGDTDVY
jgi:hypothetical protein